MTLGHHDTAAPLALRDAGLRVTAVRLAVLRAVDTHPHADADTLLRAVRDDLGTVSVQAVYDVLRAFTSAGLLRRIEPAGHPARYERRIGDNHHHVVCRGCGDVADVDCVVGHAPCLEPSDDTDFVVDTAEVTFWGLCPACVPRALRPQHDTTNPPTVHNEGTPS